MCVRYYFRLVRFGRFLPRSSLHADSDVLRWLVTVEPALFSFEQRRPEDKSSVMFSQMAFAHYVFTRIDVA
jgi:hypothetical protein